MPHSSERMADGVLLELYRRLEREKRAGDPQVWRSLALQHGDAIYSQILFLLTRKQFDPSEAQLHWLNILEHTQAMSRALGREVGVRLAMCDYLINLAGQMEDPLLVEGETIRQKESSIFRDELTGLHNRRFLKSIMQQQVAEAKRFTQPFSLIMLDVDWFKQYNDAHGHLAGDRVLAEMAGLLSASARAVDHLIRYGGEEFLVILPRAGRQEALVAAERHRLAVEKHHFAGEECLPGGRLTLSAGVACFPSDAQTATGLIHRADMALYAAKRQGRNIVVSAGTERRRHPRVKYVAPVQYRAGRNSRDFHLGETRDISPQGLRLAVNQKVEQDQPLELMIYSSRQRASLKLRGRAVHVYHDPFVNQPYTLGVSLEGGESDSPGAPLAALLQDQARPLH